MHVYISHVIEFLSVPHDKLSMKTVKTVLLYSSQQQSYLLSALGNYEKSKLHQEPLDKT